MPGTTAGFVGSGTGIIAFGLYGGSGYLMVGSCANAAKVAHMKTEINNFFTKNP